MLKALLGHAAQRGWIDAIPGADIDLEISGEEARRRERVREERALLSHEVESLLTTADLLAKDRNNAIRSAWSERYRGFTYLAAFTGARASEVLGITHGALRRYPGFVLIKQKIDKDGRAGGVKRKRSLRRVPLHSRAEAAIAEMLAARGVVDAGPNRFIFETNTGNPVLYSSIYNRLWVKLVQRNNALAKTVAGESLGLVEIENIDGSALHAFRRHAAGVLYRLGMGPAEIGDHLGQDDAVTTWMYISEQDPGENPVAPVRQRAG